MNTHSLEVLEFERVRAAVQANCVGPYGERAIIAAGPRLDASTLSAHRTPVVDWLRILNDEIHYGPFELPDIDHALDLLAKEGSVLEPSQLRDLAVISDSLQRFSTSIASHTDELPVLGGMAQAIPALKSFCTAVFAVIDREGGIREDQIPSLRALRGTIARLQQNVRKRAAAYMKDSAIEGIFTSDLPSERNGRTVLPLDAGARSRLPGIVHDVSATGRTLFIEPADIVELNNDIVDAENRYRAEVFRIVKDLSGRARAEIGSLATLPERAAVLDESRARALYMHQRDYRFCDIGGPLHLIDARHPFLGDNAVPIEIRFDEAEHMMVITGPNTGGKTVAIKTLGLLAVMNQFGIGVPVEEGSRLPLFDDVYVDIGDEQSIQRSLSTFSAHIRNLSWIMDACGPQSLVLIDELSSGTDPEEGSYLAEAILDELSSRKSICLVTTHLSPLKQYALSREGCFNASVDFDLESLSPRYTIRKGVPGTSHAIDIAERNGLPARIVNRARSLRGSGESDISRMLREIHALQEELNDRKAELHTRSHELSRAEEDLAQLRRKLNDREAELRERELADESRYVRELRSRVELVIKELRSREADEDSVRAAKQLTESVGEELDASRAELSLLRREGSRQQARNTTPAPEELGPGTVVRHRQTGKRGTIERQARGGWLVSFGAVRMTVNAEDLVPMQGRSAEDRQPSRAGVDATYDQEYVPPAIDLRGMRAQEAEDELERGLDRALVGGARRLEVIHGTGSGVLQKVARDYLRRREEVTSVSFARPEEGGFGKTIVEIG